MRLQTRQLQAEIFLGMFGAVQQRCDILFRRRSVTRTNAKAIICEFGSFSADNFVDGDVLSSSFDVVHLVPRAVRGCSKAPSADSRGFHLDAYLESSLFSGDN
jgi:hypothetical protein